MKKLMLIFLIATSIAWTPYIQSHGWKDYWKKWGTIIVLSIIFSKIFPKESNKFADLIESNPLFFRVLVSGTGSENA